MDKSTILMIVFAIIFVIYVIFKLIILCRDVQRMKEKHERKKQQRLDRAYIMSKEFEQQEAERRINEQNNNNINLNS